MKFRLFVMEIYVGELYSSDSVAFDDLKLHRIHAVCDVSNSAAVRVLEKTGMRREGCMIRRGKGRPGDPEPYFDQYGYAVLRDEWLEQKENR